MMFGHQTRIHESCSTEIRMEQKTRSEFHPRYFLAWISQMVFPENDVNKDKTFTLIRLRYLTCMNVHCTYTFVIFGRCYTMMYHYKSKPTSCTKYMIHSKFLLIMVTLTKSNQNLQKVTKFHLKNLLYILKCH